MVRRAGCETALRQTGGIYHPAKERRMEYIRSHKATETSLGTKVHKGKYENTRKTEDDSGQFRYLPSIRRRFRRRPKRLPTLRKHNNSHCESNERPVHVTETFRYGFDTRRGTEKGSKEILNSMLGVHRNSRGLPMPLNYKL